MQVPHTPGTASLALDLIVTGDDDLLTLKTYQDIPIVIAVEALRRVEAER